MKEIITTVIALAFMALLCVEIVTVEETGTVPPCPPEYREGLQQ